MLIDTHAHLDGPKFDHDRDAMLDRAKQAGVDTVINVGFDMPSCFRSIALAETYSSIYAAVGIHPHDAQTATEAVYLQIEQWAKHPKVVALGEIGLDYYRDLSPRDIQQQVFRRQLVLARTTQKPIIIHNRDAHGDIMSILCEEYRDIPGGVFHCYSGSVEMARQIISMGMYISLAGPITFSNSRRLWEVAAEIPLEWLLVETDAPYLTPEPYRGQRNEAGYVRYVAEKVAELQGKTLEEVAKVTSENARRLFRLPPTP